MGLFLLLFPLNLRWWPITRTRTHAPPGTRLAPVGVQMRECVLLRERKSERERVKNPVIESVRKKTRTNFWHNLRMENTSSLFLPLPLPFSLSLSLSLSLRRIPSSLSQLTPYFRKSFSKCSICWVRYLLNSCVWLKPLRWSSTTTKLLLFFFFSLSMRSYGLICFILSLIGIRTWVDQKCIGHD